MRTITITGCSLQFDDNGTSKTLQAQIAVNFVNELLQKASNGTMQLIAAREDIQVEKSADYE